MSFMNSVAVVGVGETDYSTESGRSELVLSLQAITAALEDAGIRHDEVDGLLRWSVDTSSEATVAANLGLSNLSWFGEINQAGNVGAALVANAAAAIHAGLCEVALILYGSTAASNSMAIGTGGSGGSRNPDTAFSSPYGMTTVGSYAMYANLHMNTYGTTSEQLAEIAVTMRRHASLNPHAKMRSPISTEDVLGSRMISRPLHLLDCCIISDGGGAIVLTSAERARDLPKPPVRILGCGEAVQHQGVGRSDLLTIAAKQSGQNAFNMAQVQRSDIDFAMIYDSFTITVLATLENLGFCEPGEGGNFVSQGGISLDGKLPVNPDGGGLSSNHPGMRGIFLVIEAVKQLRQECGERQVSNPEIALAHGTGGTIGDKHSGATLILGVDK